MFSVLIESISAIIIAFLKLFSNCYGSNKVSKKHKNKDKEQRNHKQESVGPNNDNRQARSENPHRRRRTSITETTTNTTVTKTTEFIVSDSGGSSSPTHETSGKE